MNIEDSSRSRILASKNGIQKLLSIDKTIEHYVDMDVWKIIKKTHLHGTPWDNAYYDGINNVISDDIIKEHHYIEE